MPDAVETPNATVPAATGSVGGTAGGTGGASGTVPTVTAPASEAAPWSAPPKAAEEKKEETGKEKEQPKKEEVKYDLKLPKDSHMDPAALEKFTSFAKERGFTNEQAQAVLEQSHAERQGVFESSRAALKEQNATWLKQLKDDKEFGGDKYAENANNAKAAFDRFDKDGMLRKALVEADLSNHPGLVKFVAAVGKAFSEDKLAAPTFGAPGKDSRDPVTKLKDHYAGKKL